MFELLFQIFELFYADVIYNYYFSSIFIIVSQEITPISGSQVPHVQQVAQRLETIVL
jgi:hypothetical protein